MKKNRIAFHIEPRKTVLVILPFTTISLLLDIFLILSVNKDCAQLYSLCQSKYDFSATTQESVFENDYYQFNAGIAFTLSADAGRSLNADIIMQSVNTLYNDTVYWNADALSTYGVAVSKNLSNSYNLHIGDTLYSKHIVNGAICEYSIEEILPEVANIRAAEGNSYSTGIIIMGYDEKYIENITHNSIVFTKGSVEELSAKSSGIPENIIYREDEISSALQNIIPYLAVFGAISAAIAVMLVSLLTKYISNNFRRLVMLGFKKKRLDSSYFMLTFGCTILSAFTALALSSGIFLFVEISAVKILLLIFMLFIELIALLATSIISNKQLWRR